MLLHTRIQCSSTSGKDPLYLLRCLGALANISGPSRYDLHVLPLCQYYFDRYDFAANFKEEYVSSPTLSLLKKMCPGCTLPYEF